MRTIADRIAQTLTERRMTRAELARQAGMQKSTLQSIMDTPNRSPRAETLEKLAMALGVDYAWLATGKSRKGQAASSTAAPNRHAVAQAIEDAIRETGLKIGAADRVAFMAALLRKLTRK